MKTAMILRSIALTIATVFATTSLEAAVIIRSSNKPSDNVLAQTSPDGTNPVAIASSPDVKYAAGQSFTTTTAWTLDKISVQYEKKGATFNENNDASLKLILFTYNSAGFDAAAWGPFSAPAVTGTGITQVYSEDFSVAAIDGATANDWLTFDLTTNQSLSATTEYGFALWVSNGTGPVSQNVNFFYNTSNSYAGGDRLAVRGGTGNTISLNQDLNFVLQTVPEPSTFVMLLGGLGALMLLRRRRA